MTADATPVALGPLPKPDTHCWDDDFCRDVWSYSAEAMRAYASAAVAADRSDRAKYAPQSPVADTKVAP